MKLSILHFTDRGALYVADGTADVDDVDLIAIQLMIGCSCSDTGGVLRQHADSCLEAALELARRLGYTPVVINASFENEDESRIYSAMIRRKQRFTHILEPAMEYSVSPDPS